MKKNIVCFGDSNTYGYCADISDAEDSINRFNEKERWPLVLQHLLGEEYLIIEEGLSGRTTVFDDPLHEGMSAIRHIYPILKSHEKIDLLIIMLGTNDTKERFSANERVIALGLDSLIKKAKSIDCWNGKEKILVICPPPIKETFRDIMTEEYMGKDCLKKSKELAKYYKYVAENNSCYFLDANGCEFNTIDNMHLTKRGHRELSERVEKIIKEIFS